MAKAMRGTPGCLSPALSHRVNESMCVCARVRAQCVCVCVRVRACVHRSLQLERPPLQRRWSTRSARM